jgi:hypothetical protein
MINIRTGVFETNSSSSHSFNINVATEGMLESIAPDLNGDIDEIVLNGGDFSAAEIIVESALDKANAVAVYCCLTDDDCLMNMLHKVLCEHIGVTRVTININLVGSKLNSWMSKEFAETLYREVYNDQRIKNFIFNKKSIIEAGYFE